MINFQRKHFILFLCRRSIHFVFLAKSAESSLKKVFQSFSPGFPSFFLKGLEAEKAEAERGFSFNIFFSLFFSYSHVINLAWSQRENGKNHQFCIVRFFFKTFWMRMII